MGGGGYSEVKEDNGEVELKKFLLVSMILCFILTGHAIVKGEDRAINGYYWATLNPKEKLIYVMAYVQGVSLLNEEIRNQMGMLEELYDMDNSEKNMYLAEYGKETSRYYEDNYHYYGILYQQLADGIDDIYKDYTNKTISVDDAFHLVKQRLNGRDEQGIEKSMVFMRKSDQEQGRVIRKEMQTLMERP